MLLRDSQRHTERQRYPRKDDKENKPPIHISKELHLTLELINGHLEGGLGVGAIPINEENMCKFGALDIDTYPIDHVSLDKKLRKFKNTMHCL